MTGSIFQDPQKPPSRFVSNPLPICAICNAPVRLEFAKTDESGAAIHELCYVPRVKSSPVVCSKP